MVHYLNILLQKLLIYNNYRFLIYTQIVTIIDKWNSGYGGNELSVPKFYNISFVTNISRMVEEG